MFLYLVILAFAWYCINRWLLYQKYYKKGFDGPRPLPIFGNAFDILFKPFPEYEENNFRKYGHTYVDYILDNKGVITTSNPDYVKRILIKDFHNFSHRLQTPYLQPFARKSVIFLNEDWKRVRTQVTPVFSSGRLKLMFKNFKGPVQTTLDNINELIKTNQNEYVDAKRLMKSFSLDIIGNVVFSLKTNAWKEDDFSRRVTNLFRIKRIVILFLFFMPEALVRFLKLTFLEKKTVSYFGQLTLNLIEERKKNKDVKYNDFIELLLKSESEGEVEKNFEEDGHIVKKLSVEEIVGQCFIFFVAGLETVSTVLSLLLYELSLNEECQSKLYNELKECYPTDEISYEEINKSKYLDAVINETLRKHSTLSRIFRQATADYDFGDFKVKRGQTMGISLHNLHNDPALYNEPHKFKPERFTTGELADNNSFQPIPFVDGPRNCIGNRFAMMEMKSILIPMLKSFRVFATSRTDIPVKRSISVIINMIENVTLGFEKRN